MFNNSQRVSSFTNLKWANLEMIHPDHHLSLPVFSQLDLKIMYPARWSTHLLRFCWQQLRILWFSLFICEPRVPNAKEPIEKSGLDLQSVWNEGNSAESRGHVWTPDQHVELSYHINVCLSIYWHGCVYVSLIFPTSTIFHVSCCCLVFFVWQCFNYLLTFVFLVYIFPTLAKKKDCGFLLHTLFEVSFWGYIPISKQTQRPSNSLSKCQDNLVAPSDSSRPFSLNSSRRRCVPKHP